MTHVYIKIPRCSKLQYHKWLNTEGVKCCKACGLRIEVCRGIGVTRTMEAA